MLEFRGLGLHNNINAIYLKYKYHLAQSKSRHCISNLLKVIKHKFWPEWGIMKWKWNNKKWKYFPTLSKNIHKWRHFLIRPTRYYTDKRQEKNLPWSASKAVSDKPPNIRQRLHQLELHFNFKTGGSLIRCYNVALCFFSI